MGKNEALGQALTTTEKKELTLPEMIEKSAKSLAQSLPANMSAQRMIRIAMTCIRQTPELSKVAPESFLGSLMVAAQLGLEPLAGRAWILPFYNSKRNRKEAQLIIGYKGLAELFYRHDRAVMLNWGEAREHDEFTFEYGTDAYIRHIPKLIDQGNVWAYYVIAELKGRARIFKVMTKDECLEHGRTHSKTYNKSKNEFMPDSPWVKDVDSMCKKTVLIQLAKLLPLSFELQRAIQQDETSREYRYEIDDALDIPPDEWTTVEAEQVENDKLNMNSALHKAIEAKLKDEGIDRDNFKKFKDIESFKDMTVDQAKEIVENWPETMEAFIEWDQQDKSQ